MNEILHKIVATKRAKIAELGFSLGHKIPKERKYVINLPKSFKTASQTPQPKNPQTKSPKNSPLIISEIKRKSPTCGTFDENLNAIKLAALYLDSGTSAISVLCEEDYFNGSLDDLIAIRAAFPHATLLRKDFILSKEEIEISYLCGADMVLLIAALFLDNAAEFGAILESCKDFGLLPLVEIHNEADLDFVLGFEVPLIGINSRDLKTFKISKQNALILKQKIPSHIDVIFESGIKCDFDAYLAGASGFSGILCGEYLLTHKNRSKALSSLKKSFLKGTKEREKIVNLDSAKKAESCEVCGGFYERFFSKMSQKQPLIKICGVSNIDDALMLGELSQTALSQNGRSVDLMGFILCESPRKIELVNLKNIAKLLKEFYPQILRVGVILPDRELLNLGRELVERGILDALQLHSCDVKNPNVYAGFNLLNARFPFFVSANVAQNSEIPRNSISPFILLDSKSDSGGGSGKMLDSTLLMELDSQDLFLSGGINADNLDFFLSLKPRMLDICSGSEKEKGKKDREKLMKILKIGGK